MLEFYQKQLAVTGSRNAWKSWSETIPPNPSLGNLYRTFEWMALQDTATNYHVMGLFATLVMVIYCLIASLKVVSRASTRWHVSPLVVALVLLHLSSNIEFGALAEKTSDATYLTIIESAVGFLELWHGPRRYKGPIAYTLICLAVWETLVFSLSPFILSNQHPKTRNKSEWAFYIVPMALASISIDTRIALPLIQRSGSGKFMSTQETYESIESFIKTFALFTVVLIIFTGLFALALDALLFEGCLVDSLGNSLADFPMAEKTRSSTQEREYVDSSNSTAFVTQETSEKYTGPDIDIAAHVENFMWRQMCLIKQQTQALEAEAISAETDDIGTCYAKLSRSYAAILPMRPLLDGLIAVLTQRDLPADHFRQHLSSIDEALESIKTQMYNLSYEHNDISFVRSAPDPDTERYIAMLHQDAEGFVHVQLDRQQAMDDLMEAEDELEILEGKINAQADRPVDFSIQLRTQMAALELHINRLLEERSATAIPAPPREPEESATIVTIPTLPRETEDQSMTIISTPPREPEEPSTVLTPLGEIEDRSQIVISTPPINTQQLQEQETPVEGLQLMIDSPAHSNGEGRSIEAPSLLFSTYGDYVRRRDFSNDPPIIDLTWTSPAPSPRRVPSTPARPSSTVTDENAEPPRVVKSPVVPVKKSADHMVVGLWTSAATLEFRSDNFLRHGSSSDLLKPDDLLAIGELGRYLTAKVRGNRAETAAASKILINLEKCARASKDNQTTLNVGVNNLNYFRSCMWLGQARLTKFPPTQAQDHRVFTEIPIEGIIKLAGYGPDGIKSLNMLPVPGETWAEYLERLAASSDIKKIKELHDWLERYLGGLPKLLGREVPRAEGWDTGVPLDANRCLYRHLENMMLLPPYPAEIEKELSIYRMEKADDPNFIGSALVEKVLDSPKSKDMASILRFQPL